MRTLSVLMIALSMASVASAAEPTTRPMVVLLRFAQLNDAPGTEWIGRVVQESLLTDAGRIRSLRIAIDQSTPTTDIETARQIARNAHADFVVLGGYQSIGNDLKITGQVVDVANGGIVGTLKSTATMLDVIAMEETIGRQLDQALNRASTERVEAKPQAPVAEIPKIEELGPVRIANVSLPFATSKKNDFQYYRDRHIYNYPAYSPYCGYGCYGYGYGCYGGGYCAFQGFIYSSAPTSIFYGD